jgi:Uri superfamily endonuclease
MRPIPDLPGSYALCLSLARDTSLSVGKLGECFFPAGAYLYLGSARGPGGLRARLGRHLAGGGRRRWHIDYLRAVAEPAGFVCVTQAGGGEAGLPLECRWSQSMLASGRASAPSPGFGASDCRCGCLAHLIYLGPEDRGFGGWAATGFSPGGQSEAV